MPVIEDIHAESSGTAPGWALDVRGGDEDISHVVGLGICAFVLDVYSRMIVGGRVADHMRTELPLAPRAFGHHPPPTQWVKTLNSSTAPYAKCAAGGGKWLYFPRCRPGHTRPAGSPTRTTLQTHVGGLVK